MHRQLKSRGRGFVRYALHLGTWTISALVACSPPVAMDAGDASDAVQDVPAPEPHPETVVRTMIGTPHWDFVDFHAVVVAGGTMADGYAGFDTFRDTFLAPNHRFYTTDRLIGPGAPHEGPYDTELTVQLPLHGYHSNTVFTVDDFTEPNGVVWLGMVVPIEGAPVGSSADGASGPIIPQTMFPMQISTTWAREGVVFDRSGSAYPGPTMIHPPSATDGYSHFPLQFGESSAFLPAGTAPAGHYAYQTRIVDASGSGWDYTIAIEIR